MIPWAVFGYLLVINAFALVVMAQDKASARAGLREVRTPESHLLFMAILGGSAGIYLGMFLFHHKTKKPVFLIGLPFLFLQQILLLSFFFLFYT